MKPKNSIFCQQFGHIQHSAPKACANFMEWLKTNHITMHFFKGKPEKKTTILQEFFLSLGVTFERGKNNKGEFIRINFGDLKPMNSVSAITIVFTTSEDPEEHLALACATAFETLEPQYW